MSAGNLSFLNVLAFWDGSTVHLSKGEAKIKSGASNEFYRWRFLDSSPGRSRPKTRQSEISLRCKVELFDRPVNEEQDYAKCD